MYVQPFLIPLKPNSVKKFRDILPKSKKVLIFDIDNTLYCESLGLEANIVSKIHEYAQKCGIPEEDVVDVCRTYSKEYGLAIKGFLKNFPDTDVQDFYNSVDGSVKIDSYLSHDEELIGLMKQCKYKMYCFTNACYQHAVKVLDALGVTRFISGIFYCEYGSEGDFICKPDHEAYAIVESLLHDSTIYFWDDNASNVAAAGTYGWYAQKVHVDENIKLRLSNFFAEDNQKVEVKKDLILDEINKRFVGEISLEELDDGTLKENKMNDK